jgi:hypothetical protein
VAVAVQDFLAVVVAQAEVHRMALAAADLLM